MTPRILFVSTHKELTQMARETSKELGIPLNIYEGGILRNGHIYAKNQENNYDVIISQGGTADAIRRIVSIPTVSVEIRTIDFLNALFKAKQYGTTIGLVTYKSEKLEDLYNLKELLNIDFDVFPYCNKEQLIKRIDDVTASGKPTLVGLGDCIMETAGERNLNAVLIKSGRQQVEEALCAAKNICDLSKREQQRVKQFKAIIDYSGEGIIALDENEIILSFNPAAEKMLGILADDVIGASIYEFMERKGFGILYGDGSHQVNKLFKLNNIPLIINRIPIIVESSKSGTVITFQETEKLQKLEQKVRVQLHKKGLVAKYRFDDIIGSSTALQQTIHQARKYGKTMSTILISGETGSGKELFAQSMHNVSSRSQGPFVAINCAALPESLLESELFGYEEGAFTGAKKGGKTGLFEMAHQGTIFLDEIGEIPLSIQGRLLRVLQEKEVLRVGGDSIQHVDIRVIAATNMDLYRMMKEGRFREDLYFRLNVLNLRIPSLRERREDIPQLVACFLKTLPSEDSISIESIEPMAMNSIQNYNWPGNVRELENFVEKMMILNESSVVSNDFVEELLAHYRIYEPDHTEYSHESASSISVRMSSLREMELQIIERMNQLTKGDKLLLAEKLGISRTTLWKRLKELEDFQAAAISS
jgi:transcriptional regulator with PAS, ATPase and Fis domain